MPALQDGDFVRIQFLSDTTVRTLYGDRMCFDKNWVCYGLVRPNDDDLDVLMVDTDKGENFLLHRFEFPSLEPVDFPPKLVDPFQFGLSDLDRQCGADSFLGHDTPPGRDAPAPWERAPGPRL